MAEHTGISWTDSTFNPWIGCTKVGPGCDHCYAETLMDRRLHKVQWGSGQQRQRTSAATWRQPLLWEREHEAFALMHGRRRRVFCASLADVFDNEVPRDWRDDLMRMILDTPHLDWLLLTKRIGNVKQWLDDDQWEHLTNVWLGITVVNQEEADRDVPKLLAVPARVRFLSIEPMLGDVRLGSWLQCSPSGAFAAGEVTSAMPAWTRIGSTAIDWVICGGESGPHARPMHPDWVRSLRDQCAAGGVPFHFKQWGEWSPGYAKHGNDLDYGVICTAPQHEWPEGHCAFRVGKKAAGRLLDGIEHNDSPFTATPP